MEENFTSRIKSKTFYGKDLIDSKDLSQADYSRNQQANSTDKQVDNDKLQPVSKPEGYGMGKPANPRKDKKLKEALQKDLTKRNLK